MKEEKLKSYRKFVESSELWGQPYKIVREKFSALNLPAIEQGNSLLIEDKEKYKAIIEDIFPSLQDIIPSLEVPENKKCLKIEQQIV